MKIKRFEAAGMSDALRMIKKEFGEEAVILSAKNVKKSKNRMGNALSQKVVVTAAVDTTPLPMKTQPGQSTASDQRDLAALRDADDQEHNGKLSFLTRFNPITRTGQRKLQSKFVRLASTPKQTDEGLSVKSHLISQGVADALAGEFEQKIASLVDTDAGDTSALQTALSQVIQAKELIANARPVHKDTARIVVLVGPSGVGKTTTVAKLAAAHVQRMPGRVSFLSLDDQRVAGRAELERYARILGIPLQTAADPEDLATIAEHWGPRHCVFVDTPGLGAEDTNRRDHIRCMIANLSKPEVHLLLSADAQDSAMAKAIDFFMPVGVQRLGFARLDWATSTGGLVNQAAAFDLPITYLSDTPKVTQPIQVTTPDVLAALLLPNPGKARMGRSTPYASDGISYVANRNSDIFHQKTCKSVKRINNDNMVMFNDPAEALGRQFKPCRMCCNELHISKPIQRAAYKYAASK
jgi:flagellar biosynthesis protein FlhF